MKNRLRKTLTLLSCLLCSGTLTAAPRSTQAYLLDTGGMRDVEELYLVGVLQGIVNRDAPRLFLSSLDHGMCAGSNNVYANYLEKEKGFTFTRLKTLGEAIAKFSTMKRADGVTPLIKGLVKYPTFYMDPVKKTKVNTYYNSWIAANFAAQEDLLPVTENILKCQTSMLSGSEFWWKDEKMGGEWTQMVAVLTRPTTGGLSVQTRPGGHAKKTGSANRTVYLDLDVTPKIEVVVSDLTPGGSWSVQIKSPTTVDTPENSRSISIPGLTNIRSSGTFVADLASTGLFNPRAARAQLIITPCDPATTVTVKSIRLLNAKGEDPTVAPYVTPKDVFQGLPIQRDLVAAPLYEQDEEKACEWSLANQRKQTAPNAVGSFSGGSWILKGLDYAISKKVYLFYQNREPFTKEGYPNLDKILAGLKPPGLVFGWLGSESYSCMKMGEYGTRYAGGPPENFSFWQWVPLKTPGKPIPLPQVREVKELENKIYLNFSWASADAVEFTYNLMEGYWEDPNRGKAPVTWGFNTLLAKFVPALVEFYAHSATPKDSFWGFTAGYTHSHCFSPANLKLYAEDTRRGLFELGISPAVDIWDSDGNFSPAYEEFSRTTAFPGVKLMSTMPSPRGPETYWLDNGAVVMRNDKRFHGKSQKNGKTTHEGILSDIKEIEAEYPGLDPKFLTINTRVSPTFVKELMGMLPKHVEVVGMPDFIGLAEESGAVVASPYSDGVGAGDSIKVKFQLHNASGQTGKPGKVAWTLPPGWTSSPAEWGHGPVPQGSNLKQVVTFIPPAGASPGAVKIVYQDSRFRWKKDFSLTVYPKAVNVTDCESTTGWTALKGALLTMDRDMIKLASPTGRSRADYFEAARAPANSGRVTFSLSQIDFSRNPILKITVPDLNGSGTVIGLLDQKGVWKKCGDASVGTTSIDLATITKWKGTQDITLTLDPVTLYGRFARIRNIKVCYP
jgi:GxGYxYP putative glycoside hydrolase C-terminal domain